jgi:8-oxo-dGTP diphosphatase
MPTTRYVAGFMFDQLDHTKVALIRKNHPAWMAGKLNAIGGKVEQGETELAAMVREFHEETGYPTAQVDWSPSVLLQVEDWEVTFFIAAGYLKQLKTVTDEEVVVIDTSADMTDLSLMDNVEWLLPIVQKHLSEQLPGNRRSTPLLVQGVFA